MAIISRSVSGATQILNHRKKWHVLPSPTVKNEGNNTCNVRGMQGRAKSIYRDAPAMAALVRSAAIRHISLIDAGTARV